MNSEDIIKRCEEIHKKLISMPPLLIGNHTHSDLPFVNPDTCLWDFLAHFIRDYKNNYHTYEGGKITQSSFYCAWVRRRSTSDIFRIVHYYYPNVSFLNVLQILLYLFRDKEIWMFYCRDINRRVWMDKNQFIPIYTLTPSTDELGFSDDDLYYLYKTSNNGLKNIS